MVSIYPSGLSSTRNPPEPLSGPRASSAPSGDGRRREPSSMASRPSRQPGSEWSPDEGQGENTPVPVPDQRLASDDDKASYPAVTASLLAGDGMSDQALDALLQELRALEKAPSGPYGLERAGPAGESDADRSKAMAVALPSGRYHHAASTYRSFAIAPEKRRLQTGLILNTDL